MKWRPVPLPDGSYADASKPFSSQDLINLYPEFASGEGTRSSMKLVDSPGLREFLTFGDGPVRGMRNVEGKFFVVSDTGLYQVHSATEVEELGTIPGRSRVWMSHNQVNGGNEVVVGTGTDGYLYNTASKVFQKITDSGFPGFRWVDFLNQRFLGIEPQRRYLFNSAEADGLSYDSVERYQAESAPDRLVTGIVSHEQVIVFGERTTQFFAASSDPADIANHILYRTIPGTTMQVGAASPHGVSNLDNATFFVDNEGNGRELRGYTSRIITPPAIAKAWRTKEDGSNRDLSKCFCMTYEQDAHHFWFVTFPDGHTWAYDVSTQKWHRRQSKGMNRWRLNTMCEWGGQWYGGSYNSGMIYKLDPDYMKEGCDEHTRTFRTGVLHDEGNRVSVPGIRIEFDSGYEESVCVDVDPVTPSSATYLAYTTATNLSSGSQNGSRLGYLRYDPASGDVDEISFVNIADRGYGRSHVYERNGALFVNWMSLGEGAAPYDYIEVYRLNSAGQLAKFSGYAFEDQPGGAPHRDGNCSSMYPDPDSTRIYACYQPSAVVADVEFRLVALDYSATTGTFELLGEEEFTSGAGDSDHVALANYQIWPQVTMMHGKVLVCYQGDTSNTWLKAYSFDPDTGAFTLVDSYEMPDANGLTLSPPSRRLVPYRDTDYLLVGDAEGGGYGELLAFDGTSFAALGEVAPAASTLYNALEFLPHSTHAFTIFMAASTSAKILTTIPYNSSGVAQVGGNTISAFEYTFQTNNVCVGANNRIYIAKLSNASSKDSGVYLFNGTDTLTLENEGFTVPYNSVSSLSDLQMGDLKEIPALPRFT